jgi:hypothetical protein
MTQNFQQEVFLFSKVLRSLFMSTQPTAKWAWGIVFLTVKQLGHDCKRATPSSVEGKTKSDSPASPYAFMECINLSY